jgi:hypothetical protein
MSSKTKKSQAQATRNTAALTKASALDLSKSLNALTTSGVVIQGTLSKISEELITKHAELQAVVDTINLKKAEMEALHGVDQVLLTVDEARENHRLQLEQMQKERDAAQQAHIQLVKQNGQDRSRDEANYSYDLQQQRKAEADAWTEKLRVRNNEERDRQEKFEKNHVEREAILRLRETAYNDALAKIATFDAEVTKASDKAAAIATGSLKKDYTHDMQMVVVKHEAELAKIKFDNQRLIEAANNLEKQLSDALIQLKAAHEAQTQLAKDAVAAASNKQAQADAMAMLTNIGGNGQNRART